MYSSECIKWIKNVKRKDGIEWAYQDVSYDKSFLLNWPTYHKRSALTPEVGDIIVLFQKPTWINDKRNKTVYFTHLVTPISNELVEDLNSPAHKWARKVKLIVKADPIESIPSPAYFNFLLPNRGLTNPILNLRSKKVLSEPELRLEVWALFKSHFKSNDLWIDQELDELISAYSEFEGDKIIREHIKQEFNSRNYSIVKEAKREALKKGNGKINCECCAFDFFNVYGNHGYAFIECHHKIHLSLGERITKITDLALVCSNCHRMLHRKNKEGSYFTIQELKNVILNKPFI